MTAICIDNVNERLVQDALDRAKEGRTTIVIAHRLSTIRNADLVIGLESGHVLEYGTYDDLMKREGLHYELVTDQMQKEESDEDKDFRRQKAGFDTSRYVLRKFDCVFSFSTTRFVNTVCYS